MRKLQILTTCTFLLAAVIATLFEADFLESGYRAVCGPTEKYIVDALCALSVVVCVPVAVKSSKRPWLRWVLLSISAILDLLIYYIYLNDLSLPCAAIAGVALIMLWPNKHTPEI